MYTVAGVNQIDESNKLTLLAGFLPYQNNPFQNCSIDRIQADYTGIERTATQIAIQQWGIGLTAYCNCKVETPYGVLSIDLTTSYDLNPSDNSAQSFPSSFPGRNETGKPSLWWGESLLAWYYEAATRDIETATGNEHDASDTSLYKGSATFSRSSDTVPTADDIKSLDFFNAGCFFIAFSNTGVEHSVYYCHATGMGNKDLITTLLASKYGDSNHPLPGIWLSSDTLAKIFYFTIMADLGQGGPSAGENILTNPDLLEFYSSNITDIQNDDKSEPWGANIHVERIDGVAHEPYSKKNSVSPGLGFDSPSVIATNYLCQEPNLKSRGTLIVSVLVNNLAILGTLWGLYKFLIDYILMRKHPELNACQGCATVGNGSNEAYYQGVQPKNLDDDTQKLLPRDVELQSLSHENR